MMWKGSRLNGQMAVVLCSLMLLACENSMTNGADYGEPQSILQSAIEAAGGAGRLATFKSPMLWMERGTFFGMGDGVPFVGQYAAQWPDWYRQEIEDAFAITVNKDQAWVTSGNGQQLLDGGLLQEQLIRARSAWAERLFPLANESYQLAPIDGVEVEGRPTVGFVAKHPDHRDVTFYWDAETFLIAKIQTMVVSPQHGSEPVLSETYYSDHKSYSGVTIPAKFRVYYAGKQFIEGEIVDYKFAATLDPAMFRAPDNIDRRDGKATNFGSQ